MAEVGQYEIAAPPRKQLLAKSFFELVNLRADRGVCEMQLLTGAGNAPLLGDCQEVAQVMIVQASHARSISRVVRLKCL